MVTFRFIRSNQRKEHEAYAGSAAVSSYAIQDHSSQLQSTTHHTAAVQMAQTGFEFPCPQPATITVTRIFDQRIWIATSTRPDRSNNCSSHSAARVYSSSPHQQLALATARFQLSAACNKFCLTTTNESTHTQPFVQRHCSRSCHGFLVLLRF